MRSFLPFLAALLTLVNVAYHPSATAQSKDAHAERKGIEFFEKRIRPVLVQHCYKCHSTAKKIRGGLALDSRAAMLEGGDSGPVIEPGSPKTSLLIKAIEYADPDLQMPPKAKLPDQVIADFRKWVAMGAPDPRGTKTVGKSYGVKKDLWSLRPISDPEVPSVRDKSWPRTPVDHFILARLEAKGLRPVGDAGPEALLRRLYYDLVGLPPSPEDQLRFQAAAEVDFEKAWTAEVDRLLASPQYGERWGRHWLDVARFGESNGRDRDVLFPHAWRYRRYVIDALNADKPFDRFITEQVAGDLLPAESAEQRNALLIATGFLTLGPKSFMKKGKAFEMDLIDEQIDVTTRAFLGLTVSCARCHDHKFDPIPTKDYYSLAGIFASTKTLFGPSNRAKKAVNLQPLATAGEEKPDPNAIKRYNQLKKQIQTSARRLKRIKNRAAKAKEQAKLRSLQRELKQLEARLPRRDQYCMAVREGSPTNLRVMIRGDFRKLGEPAPRGFLTCVSLLRAIRIDPKKSGRLELAKWLTDPANPLTSRVAVNRIWHHLFGQGLVRTVDNFGANGELPSHPKLLDYLARRFIEQGWSFKRMIRRLVMSRTYRLAASYDAKNYAIDPDNRLNWRRSLRRLEVEALRDTMLAASGRLELSPPKRSPVAEIGYGEVGRGINTAPLKQPFFHRTVYMPILRTAMPEVLKVWDFPEPSLVVGARAATTVPNQALYLMNNTFVIDCARSMARRLRNSVDNDSQRIELAYRLALSRSPSDAERDRALAFLERLQQQLPGGQSPQQRAETAWTSFCQALFASAEFRYVQ